MSKKKETRCRSWAVIVYPESAPENWRSILDDLQIEWVESPLHEFDVTESTGEAKKPHWHLVLAFSQVKSFDQICEMIKPLNCPIPQRCHNLKAAVRYMAHLDHPDKHQYSINDIVSHGGADLASYLKPSASERYTMIKDMCEYVREHNIIEFHALMDYAMVEHFDDWFPALCDNSAYVVNQYIKSNRQRNQDEIYRLQRKGVTP